MDQAALSDFIGQTALFDTLSPSDRDALAARLVIRHYNEGETIFARGDAGASMFIVQSGAVQIFLAGDSTGERLVLADARAGDYFGELSLFDAKPRSASVVAILDTELLELSREDFADYLARSATAAMTIMAELAERLRETNALLSQRVAKDAVREIEQNLTWGQRLADRVAELNGSWTFVAALLALTLVWALLNSFLEPPLDRYPFVFFNLLLGILVALQGPLIVMSQNRQQIKDRAQAETDYRVNLKNEIGIERLLAELSAFRAEAQQRLGALERRPRTESQSFEHRPPSSSDA